MPQILQSFIISLSSLQSPWCQPFLIKMAEMKVGLATQAVTTGQPWPTKGWGRQGRQPQRCLFHKDSQILFTPMMPGVLKSTGRHERWTQHQWENKGKIMKGTCWTPRGSLTTRLTSRPAQSRSSADLLCSTASWDGRGKREKGSSWRNTSLHSLADTIRANWVFPLSKQGGSELREVWERGPGDTTTRSPPDAQRTWANTTPGFISRNSTKLLTSKGFYLPERLLRYFKYSSLFSPKVMKTPETPLA